MKPKTKEIGLGRDALRGKRAQGRATSEKRGDGWRGGRDVGRCAGCPVVEAAGLRAV